VSHRLPGLVALVAGALALLPGTARASGPVVTLSPTNARLQTSGSTLAEAIDALARKANFKVTYEGARPSGMLFSTDIDTPSVAQTLFRLLEGQRLNYAVVLDLTGKNVTLLMVLGPPARAAGTGSGGGTGGTRSPAPFATPRAPRNEVPVVDEDPPDEPEPTPTPGPSASPAPAGPAGSGATPGGPVALPPSPYQISPFGPRPPIGVPPGAPRPSPSPSP